VEAEPTLRRTSLANLRRGTHDLEVSLQVLPEFTPCSSLRLRYSLLASVDGACARLWAYEKDRFGKRRRRDADREARAYAQMLRAAATAFLDYTSPYAHDAWRRPWPGNASDYNRDAFLPRFFRWEEIDWFTDLGSFEPVFETRRSLVDVAPLLISELASYFTVEYAVSTKKAARLFK
jgi:hypothetical protein